FYAPLMAATALLAWSMTAPGRCGQILLALFSVLLCTLHYFGVIVLLLLIIGTGVSQRRSWRSLWPAGFGPVALIACLPLFLQQRASLPHRTWLSNLDQQAIWEFVRDLFPLSLLMILVAGIILALLTKPRAQLIRSPILALL